MKRGTLITIFCVYIFLCAIMVMLPFSYFNIHGYGITSAIAILIQGEPIVYIDHPENVTYNFNIGSRYTLNLDVFSNNDEYIDSWWYKLEDLHHSNIVYERVFFTPNITFDAVRWSNKLTVFANNSQGETGSASVIFYIQVPNSAPILDNITSPLYACEDSAFSHSFKVNDLDENALTLDLFPKDPFFVYPYSVGEHIPPFYSSIISAGNLRKSHVGSHNETLSVTDGSLSDFKNFTIDVIEINHYPNISEVGVQTVWDKGDNRRLYLDFWASDIEDGNESSNNLTYNISFANEEAFFSIDFSKGIINWIASPIYDGVHNLTVCVIDQGLANPHANISLCNSTGASLAKCVNFSLTVTDENRAPYYVSYLPASLNFTVHHSYNLSFFVDVKDPDGTIPDIYWYVDDLKGKNRTSGMSNGTFDYNFSCSQGGYHQIKNEITDGLLNASVNWTIFVDTFDCVPAQPAQPGGTGGGGGGDSGGPTCEDQWVCKDWSTCQNLEFSYLVGNITDKDYADITTLCSILGLNTADCGFQVRDCNDLNSCMRGERPSQIQACIYSRFPSCNDGIKNCHLSGCELLTDCGGPCLPCPSCSDGRQNQGEAGVDCGGPCPFICDLTDVSPKKIKFNYTLIFLTLLILIVAIIIVMKVIQIIKMRKEAKNLEWYKLR